MTEGATSGRDTQQYFTLSDIRCDNLPGRAGRYFVSTAMGGNTDRTADAIRSKSPAWTEQFTYTASDNSPVVLTVYKRQSLGWKKAVGFARIDPESRLDAKVDQDISLQLTRPGNSNSKVMLVAGATIRCKITVQARTEAVDQAVLRADADAKSMNVAPALVQTVFGDIEEAGTISNTIEEDAVTWEPVLESVKLFATMVKDISKVHPYARAALTVLSVIPKVINDQLKTDQQLRNLVAAMKHAHEFARKATPLEKIEMHAEYFEKLACATLECAHLIQEYVRTDNFAMRTVKNISGKARERLTTQIESLRELMNQFGQDAAIYTEISVMRTLELTESVQADVDKMTAKSYLDDMMYAKGAGCVPEKRCLEGTRSKLLEDISDRLHGTLNGEQSKRILLLTGVAGSGKSAIAHEIAHQFRVLRRLGASFCFSAAQQTERSVDRFLSTISRGLADVDDEWRHALVEVIKSDREVRTTQSPLRQLEEFILKPARQLGFVGPVVVVIDAIDEVAEKDRDALLNCLSSLARDKNLPDNIRFLITSRPDGRTVNELRELDSVYSMDITKHEAEGDIRLFIEHELMTKTPESEWAEIRTDWVPFLTKRAEGLFQWAATACTFVTQRLPGSPRDRFLELTKQPYPGLYQLYDTVLNQLVQITVAGDPFTTKEVIISKIQHILALILTAREPLSWQAWVGFLGEEDAKDFKAVIPYLGSVVRGVAENGVEPIQPTHTSFRDYATRPNGTQTYAVDTSAAEKALSVFAFRVMKDGLKFNICNLETSYIPNKDVKDLSSRIANNVPAALMYACRFWDTHLKAAPLSLVSLEDVRLFLEKRLLYWLEVMALNKMVDSASRRIKELCKWIKGNDGLGTAEDPTTKLDGALADVDQFISMCGAAISLSTPHLYLSALAYVPATSFLNRYYSDIYTCGICVINKDELRWPECVMRIATSSSIYGVAVSPDGRIIATAHGDHTVGLWNAVTGERVGEPLVGHTDWVRSVAFCQDGTTIVSGSSDHTVRLWNIVTGEQIGDALRGHSSDVRSVAFSPDGQTLVSGSYDKTVRLWHVSRREPAGEALVGHTGGVNSVAFSPGGRIFASGSYDRTVRVWSAETRELLYALEGHTDHVWSVAFSPDSRTLASGAEDNMIQLWDAASGQPKGDPLAGHTSLVTSVVFSPDGRTLASGSDDMTVRLWQVDTGQPVGDPLRGHTEMIWSIAFLSDSLTLVSGADDRTVRMWKIDPTQAGRARSSGHSEGISAVAFSQDNNTAVSASSDRTIRLWDVCTGQPVGEPLRGHTDEVRSVVFSPDGRTIASGSDDHTIRLWNAQTGQLQREPLVGHSGAVYSVAFSHDSKIIASGSDDRTIRLWSAVTGEELGEPLTGHTNRVLSVAFSPNGQCLASGSADWTIMLWDVTTRQPIGKPLRLTDYVRAVAFSPDGTSIASGSDEATIELWRVDTQELIGAPFEGHTDSVFSVAFSPDGKTLVSGSRDHTIRLWDVATHAAIGGPLRGHSDWVNSVAFSPDGLSILSGSNDHTVRLWSLPFGRSPLPTHPSSYKTSLVLPPPLKSRDVSPNEPTHTITTTITGSVIDAIDANESLSGPSATSQHILNTDSSDPDDNGYMLGPEGQLLFWVPPDYRAGLCRTSTRWVTGARSVHLDLSHFTHGEHWIHCRAGGASQ